MSPGGPKTIMVALLPSHLDLSQRPAGELYNKREVVNDPQIEERIRDACDRYVLENVTPAAVVLGRDAMICLQFALKRYGLGGDGGRGDHLELAVPGGQVPCFIDYAAPPDSIRVVVPAGDVGLSDALVAKLTGGRR